MRIIISPAKKMNINTDTLACRSVPVYLKETGELLEWTLACRSVPVYLKETGELLEWMRSLSYAEAKEIWKCNDKIAEQNYRRFQEMDLERNLTPAVITYEGIQYQYMAPAVFGGAETDYIQEHLRILSGFYGVLKPFDGVVPYRLEMQAKASAAGDLYRFWGDKLYREVVRAERPENGKNRQGSLIINLASKEYSKCVEKYLKPEDTYLTIVFGEMTDGKVKQKGTFAKMARGEMVRFMAENEVEDPEEIKGFDRLGYRFEEALSDEREYIFLK